MKYYIKKWIYKTVASYFINSLNENGKFEIAEIKHLYNSLKPKRYYWCISIASYSRGISVSLEAAKKQVIKILKQNVYKGITPRNAERLRNLA